MYRVLGEGPLILAHRGGGAEAPENTPEAFQALRDIQVFHVETDAHRWFSPMIRSWTAPTQRRANSARGRGRRGTSYAG